MAKDTKINNNVVNLFSGRDGGFDKGGEPPDDDAMEARVQKLEDFALDTRDRLARIEVRLDSFATKSDIADMNANLHKEINAQTWKLVTFVCGFGTALVAAVYFIATHANAIPK